MKPNEDYNLHQYNVEDLDFEISPLELVQDVGVLVVEGRLPEFSSNGRREGNHCWPVSPCSEKKCCQENTNQKSSLCNFVKTTRKRMEKIWQETMPIFIEVLVCLENLLPRCHESREPCEIYFDCLPECWTQRTLLLERWELKVNNKSSGCNLSSYVSINMMLQAIRSFLHFSQLSAWFIRTGGRIPSRLIYRIIQGKDNSQLDFNSAPDVHFFPQALVSRKESIAATVFSLPRLNLETLISMSPYREYNLLIERQIWLCSHQKKATLNQGSITADEIPDSEETPSKLNGRNIKAKQHQKESVGDVIFVPEPLAHSKKKIKREKQASISSALRKRLSFENHDEREKELPCFQVDRKCRKNIQRKHGSFVGFEREKDSSSCNEVSSSGEECCNNGENNDNSTKELHDTGNVMERFSNDSNNGVDDFNGNTLKSGRNSCEGSVKDEMRSSDQYRQGGKEGKIFHIGNENRLCDVRRVPEKNDSKGECFGLQNGKGSWNLPQNVNSSSPLNNGELDSSGSCRKNHTSCVKNFDLKTDNPNLVANCDIENGLFRNGKEEHNSMSLSEQIANGKCESKARDSDSVQFEIAKESNKTISNVEGIPINHSASLADIHGKSPEKIQRSVSCSGARPRPVSIATKLSLGACTVPVFHSKTGLPVNSSPAPLRKPEKLKTFDQNENGKFLSPSVEIRKTRKISAEFSANPAAKLLSRSAPASTRLLGNFEESVLKGRLPVFGTVEGFTAEIGASGSFCPKHITLPIKCQFFRTSDDNAPSPYMGHIALKNAKGKRGYHVPRKGTVQLTLFNPNKTVVKVFVVLYDLSDMPSISHTFLRQKIVSVRNVDEEQDGQWNLHYLVHLRFASTRHNHIYLHTDIRLIFPQQTPDVSSSKLKVMTYGPIEPKYTPRDR